MVAALVAWLLAGLVLSLLAALRKRRITWKTSLGAPLA